MAFDRYLYREPYDYQRIIRETSRALSNTIELPAILDCVGGVIRDVLKPEWIAVYLLDEDEEQLERAWQAGSEDRPANLALSIAPGGAGRGHESARLPRRAGRAGGGRRGPARDDPPQRRRRRSAPRGGASVRADRARPEALGQSRTSRDDADLLQTLAHQSAVAIRNAQTHQRVVQVNEELRKTLATIESGVVAVGARGRVTVFNKAAEQFTGQSAEAFAGAASSSCRRSWADSSRPR